MSEHTEDESKTDGQRTLPSSKERGGTNLSTGIMSSKAKVAGSTG